MNSVLEQIANLRSGRWNGIAIPHRFALFLALSGPDAGGTGLSRPVRGLGSMTLW